MLKKLYSLPARLVLRFQGVAAHALELTEGSTLKGSTSGCCIQTIDSMPEHVDVWQHASADACQQSQLDAFWEIVWALSWIEVFEAVGQTMLAHASKHTVKYLPQLFDTVFKHKDIW